MSLVNNLDSTLYSAEELTSLDKLTGLLDPGILNQAFKESGVATVRKRRLPLNAVMWSVIGMSLFRNESVWGIASQLDISLPSKSKLVAPSALVQARQRLGYKAVMQTFKGLATRAFEEHAFEKWQGLNLLAVDCVMYRTYDNAQNRETFGSGRHAHGENSYPEIRMCCLMEVSSHLILASQFDGHHVGETTLAQQLVSQVPNNSLTMFDRGFYSLGLLYSWQSAGENTHWMLPARDDTKFEIVKSLSENDAIVTMTPTWQAQRKFPNLPKKFEMRLTSYKVNGKTYRVLSSLTDDVKYPYKAVIDIYTERWEIELGYREIKQTMLQSSITLRSRKPEMVIQEVWGLLIAYNLIRIAMIDAVKDEEIRPNRLSFKLCATHVFTFLRTISILSPGKYPIHYESLMETLRLFKLPDKKVGRKYPREVRKRPSKYPVKKRK